VSLDHTGAFQPQAAYTGADQFNGVSAATLCGWFRHPTGSIGGSDDYMALMRDLSTNAGLSLHIDSATSKFQSTISATGGNIQIIDDLTLAQRGGTAWHFYAVVWDTTNSYIYIDGDVFTGTTTGTLDTSDNSLDICHFPGLGSGFDFDGHSSNVMSFQRALSVAELSALRWNPEAWETDASNITHLRGYDDKIDYGGHANAVTFSGTIASSQSDLPPTLIDGATNVHDFDGTNDGLVIDLSGDALSARTTYTYLIYHKSDAGDQDDHIIGTDNGAGTFGSLIQVLNSSGTPYNPSGIVRRVDLTNVTLNGVGLANATGWHHVALSIDLGPADGCKLFVDGVEEDTATLGATGGLLSDDFIHIGNAGVPVTNAFDGKAAWAAGVKAALTLEEVRLYKNQPDLLLERTDLHFFVALDHRGYRDLGPNAFSVDIDTTRPTPTTGGPPVEFSSGGDMPFTLTDILVPHAGDAVSDISIDTTAGGSNPNRRADGVTDISISTTAGGSNPNRRANGNQGGIFILQTAGGSNSAHHGAGVSSIEIVTAGTGKNATIHGDGATLLSISTAGAGLSGGISGLNNPLPLPTVTGVISTSTPGSLEANLPKLQVDGFLEVSLALHGSPSLPVLQITGGIESDQFVTLPVLSVNGVMFNGAAINGAPIIPVISIDGTLVNGGPAIGVGTFGALQVVGTVVSGMVATGSPVLPKLKTTGVLVPENLISGNLTLPFLIIDPKMDPLAAGSAGGGSVILPLLRVLGQITNASSLTQTVWAMNTESFETSNYLNFNFTSLVSYADQPYGVTASGIFLLEGADDDGVQIDAEFLTGIEDFTDEDLKEMAQLYLEYEGGNVVLRVFPDGQVRVREYPVERQSNATGVKHARFKGARGLRSRSWQLGMKNLGGSDFTIDKLGLLLRKLSRKTRKN